MTRTPAYEVQKNFGKWQNKAYRKTVPVSSLSDVEMAMVENAEVDTEDRFTLNDIPDTTGHDN